MSVTCNTKYPIILVHGAGFRDRKHLNYWGRIPAALEREGAVVYYGHQDSWGSVEQNAQVLKASLVQVLESTGCERVNIIAHSKGGLEARYIISSMGMAAHVASLTTVATPHHGSGTIDVLLRFPNFLYKAASLFVNGYFKLLGDKNPDFYTSLHQFATGYMERFNEENPDCDGVYYQSYASVMKTPFSDLILFWPNLVISLLEGPNDGMVTVQSAQWTNFQGAVRGVNMRGISHADAVDMRRVNFSRKTVDGRIHDIRVVYRDIVSGLRERGL